MLKQLSVILATVASILLIFAILFCAVSVGMSDKTFITNEYTKLGLSKDMGISNADLVNSCLRLINYMKGDVPDIKITVDINGEPKEMFDQPQEISHMKDAKTLYMTVKTYAKYAAVAAFALYLLAMILSIRRGPFHSAAKGYVWGTFLSLLFVGFIGTWAALDFSSFWTMFHQALFWNDDWLFDPTTSRMINMLPEEFFQDIVLRIAIYGVAAVIVLLIIAILIVSSYNRRTRKEYEETLERIKKRRARRKRLEAKKAAALKSSPEEAETAAESADAEQTE